MKKHNIKPTQKTTNTNDIICTPDFIVDFLHQKILPHVKKSKDKLKIFNPAIGKGNLTNKLKANGAYVIGNDIQDVSMHNVQADELYNLDMRTFDKKFEDIDLAIVNPPFSGCGNKLLYPEVFLDKIFESCGYNTPTIIITPQGLRFNCSKSSKRYRKFVEIYNPISSVICLPKDSFGTLIHCEILVFNVDNIKPTYFLDTI
ncbi:hypothetical protein [Moritella viscosa]|uniref:hypothetical protein n=1 Tax=Moritella viscosa TaxID=80854 RepID=UPI000919AA27|nr:hypothetical protein [Moritella viscosa]SGZ17505.1 Putative N6 adenine-specific DNA methyltransferase, probably truncated [Moritella viscosa]